MVDDLELPQRKLFERDGYHVERWSQIKNLSQLSDGHFDLILLDVHGVGLRESPDQQGLGILRHIKESNPAQPVILYSAQPQSIDSAEILSMADVVLDKDSDYVRYRQFVDQLLLRRASPGYFLAAMNKELDVDAALVPKFAVYALRAMQSGNTRRLVSYLRNNLGESAKIDRILTIVSIAVTTLSVAT